MSKNNIAALVHEVSNALLNGEKCNVRGFGTFSTCSRKDSNGNLLCKIAMFRASAELRQYFLSGTSPELADQHVEALTSIIESMRVENGIDVPKLGRFEVRNLSSEKPKIVFVGSDELNNALEK